MASTAIAKILVEPGGTKRLYDSVVLFVNHPLALEAQLLETAADIVHHLLQAADINVDIAPFFQSFQQMLLHSSHTPVHFGSGRVKVGQKRKFG